MSEEKNGQLKIGLTIPIWVLIGCCVAVTGNLTLLNYQQAIMSNEINDVKMEIRELARKVDRLTEKTLSQK